MKADEDTATQIPESAADAAAGARLRSDWWSAAAGRHANSALIHLAIILPLALVMFSFQLGRADWEDDSESCAGQIIQEMIAGNGWVLPLRNARHIPAKPPLFYWLGAVSATVRHSGVDLLDPRLPSAMLATLGIAIVYAFARRVAGSRVALWSALILVTTPQFVIEARNSRVDMTFCIFLAAGLFLAQRVCQGKAGRRVALLAAFSFGLATLSKGPLAFVLAALVLGTEAVVARPLPGWRALIAPSCLLAGVGIPALWYGAATIAQGWAFLRLHFYAENASRLLGQQGHYPLWWYVWPLLAGGLPWTLALPGATRKDSALPAPLRRFLWVWVSAMFAFFSLSPGKRRAYLLVLRPALAILLAGWLAPRLTQRHHGRHGATAVPRLARPVLAGLVVLTLVGIGALRFGLGGFGSSETQWSYWWRLYLQEHPLPALGLIAGIGAGSELMLRWTWRRRFDLAAYALTGTLAWGFVIGISATAIVRGNGGSFQHLARQISERVRSTAPLAFFEVDDETAIALLFHVRRHIPVVQAASPDYPCAPPAPGFYLVAEHAWDDRSCFRDPRWQAIERGGPAVDSLRWRRLVLARYEPQASKRLRTHAAPVARSTPSRNGDT